MELINWLDELRIHDAPSVGDDAATLGELVASGVRAADGFVLSAAVLRRMLINVGVDPAQLREDDVRDAAWLQARLLDGPIDPCAVAQLIAATGTWAPGPG